MAQGLEGGKRVGKGEKRVLNYILYIIYIYSRVVISNIDAPIFFAAPFVPFLGLPPAFFAPKNLPSPFYRIAALPQNFATFGQKFASH